MEDLIFVVLFVAIPTILLTMGFIAVLTQDEEAFRPPDDQRRSPPGDL